LFVFLLFFLWIVIVSDCTGSSKSNYHKSMDRKNNGHEKKNKKTNNGPQEKEQKDKHI
jgi:hypothetical protein